MGRNNYLNMWETCPFDGFIICKSAEIVRKTKEYNNAPTCESIIEALEDFKECRACTYYVNRLKSRFEYLQSVKL